MRLDIVRQHKRKQPGSSTIVVCLSSHVLLCCACVVCFAASVVSGYQPERGFAVLSNFLSGAWTGRPITALMSNKPFQSDLDDSVSVDSVEFD